VLAQTVRRWCWVHKWSSLVCTAFLFVLCLSGLPLIFHDEIDQWLGDDVAAPARAESAGTVSADEIARAALDRAPGLVIQFLTPDRDAPIWRVNLGTTASARDTAAFVYVDARTGDVLRVSTRNTGPVMDFILRLHTDLLAGQTGSWILVCVGLLFLVSVVSGIVVYGPFMRKLEFGSIRRNSTRAKWLDLHNLLGIAITLWLLVVGATGAINALSTQIARHWQRTELVSMISAWKDKPPPQRTVPIQTALDAARAVSPNMALSTIAVPGNAFAGPHHYDVFMRGNSPLTSRIIKPVMVDAETGEVTDTRELPLYAKALFVSQPLHFGDYGSLPLKVLWALLDIMALIVLWSGLRLWFRRAPLPPDAEAFLSPPLQAEDSRA
jgi:uncharacterized iron-regulated membrane protein